MAGGRSPAAILFDKDGNPVLVPDRDGRGYRVAVQLDSRTMNLLEEGVRLLRALNNHAATVTEEQFDGTEGE